MDEIADLIDRLDNLVAALDLPLPAAAHVDCLRGSLPEIAADLKTAYIAAGGDDHWEHHP